MNLDYFQEHGYQVVRDVLDRDAIATVRDFLEHETGLALRTLHQGLGSTSIPELCGKIDSAANSLDFANLDASLRQTMCGHFPLATRLSRTLLWRIPQQPRLRAVVEKLLGDQRLFLHMPPTARFVLPGNRHAGVPAHQDVSYNPHMTNFVTAWTPFTLIDDECGGVAVFEGSNQEKEILSNPERKFWFAGIPTDGFRKVHCTMEPGDVLLLNRWIIHASVPNVSDRIRYSIDFRFLTSQDTSSKHILDMQSWNVIEPKM